MTSIEFVPVSEPPAWFRTSLLGADLASVMRVSGHTWQFGLAAHCTITTDSLWRLLTPKGIVVTSEDDGQAFGLPSAVEACELIMATITLNMRVTAASISPVTADLRLDFGEAACLEIISTSSGYEAWHFRARVNSEDREIVALGGGGLSVPK